MKKDLNYFGTFISHQPTTFIGAPPWAVDYIIKLNIWMRLVIHIPFIPIVAGIGYEVLKLTAKHRNNIIFKILAKPGLWLQNITTKQPEDAQVEVALRALEEAFGDDLEKFTGKIYVAEAIG